MGYQSRTIKQVLLDINESIWLSVWVSVTLRPNRHFL